MLFEVLNIKWPYDSVLSITIGFRLSKEKGDFATAAKRNFVEIIYQNGFLFCLRVDNIRRIVSEESTQYMRNYRDIKSSLKKLEEFSQSVGEKINQMQRKDQPFSRRYSCLTGDDFQENNPAQSDRSQHSPTLVQIPCKQSQSPVEGLPPQKMSEDEAGHFHSIAHPPMGKEKRSNSVDVSDFNFAKA